MRPYCSTLFSRQIFRQYQAFDASRAFTVGCMHPTAKAFLKSILTRYLREILIILAAANIMAKVSSVPIIPAEIPASVSFAIPGIT